MARDLARDSAPAFGETAVTTTREFLYNEAWLAHAWRRWLSAYAMGHPVVDYGCGIGVNGSILRGLGVPRVVGLDFDWGCLTASRSRGLTVVQADLTTGIPLRDGCADIVLLIHVLEHFARGAEVLEPAARVLRPGGAAVVVTPDWTRAYKDFYDDPTHRRPYSQASLARVLLEAGLEPRVMLQHNVGYGLGRTALWCAFPRLCFTGDALFAIAERRAGGVR